MISNGEMESLGCRPADVLELAKWGQSEGVEKPNLFLIPADSVCLSSGQLRDHLCECLRAEFPVHIFETSLRCPEVSAAQTQYVCFIVDSSRPERVKDIIKEQLWATRDTGRACEGMASILQGRYEKRVPEFRLEKYGLFIPFKTGKAANVRTLSFYHRPTFYRYRVASTRSDRIPRPMGDYLEAMFTSCPNHLFNRGTCRASAIRGSLLNIDVAVEKVPEHEMVSLAKQSQSFKRVKSRHENLQKFLLESDPNTIACEVPVWVEPWEFEEYSRILGTHETLTGHVDVLRCEGERELGVWDYKPNAADESSAGIQVFLYALMLSLRTGLPMTEFICGYFDEENAYVFKPSEVKLAYD